MKSREQGESVRPINARCSVVQLHCNHAQFADRILPFTADAMFKDAVRLIFARNSMMCKYVFLYYFTYLQYCL